MAEIKIDIINQMKDALIQSLLKDGIVLPIWHDIKTDPPKEDGTYLVCRYPFYHPEGEVTTSNYALNLRKVDDLDFEEERSGWWYYNDEWGFKEEGPFDYWMPLPKPPKKEKKMNDIPVIDLTSMPGGRGFAQFIIKVKDHNGDIIDIDCCITEAKVDIEENLVPRFRYLDDTTLMKNNRLFFRDPPSCDVHAEIHGEVKSVKKEYKNEV